MTPQFEMERCHYRRTQSARNLALVEHVIVCVCVVVRHYRHRRLCSLSSSCWVKVVFRLLLLLRDLVLVLVLALKSKQDFGKLVIS